MKRPLGPVKQNLTPIGNFVNKENKILLFADLVNYNKEPKDVWITADIQYVEGKAVGLMETAVHLLSIGTCESSREALWGIFVRPPKGQKIYSLKGDIVVKDDGKILAIRGHMHDGGINIVVRRNGEVLCDSKAEYSAASTEGQHHGGGGMEGGISNMSICVKPGRGEKGEKLELEAYYDYNMHPGRERLGGGMAENMALAVLVFGKELK